MIRSAAILTSVAGLMLISVDAVLRADVIYLSNGGRVDGELLNPDESPRSVYLVKTDSGGKLVLSEDQVERIVRKSELRRSYEARLRTLPDTVAAHWDIAQRCVNAGMKDEQQFHLEQILRLDPDHKEARQALGYSFADGRWLTRDDWMTERGYVRDGGRWKLPQEVEIEASYGTHEEAVVDWRRQLKIWRSWIIKGRDNATQGLTEIQGIRDPLAAPALVELLVAEDEPQLLKLLYIDVLGRLDTPASTSAFIERALVDADARVRDASLDQITFDDPKQALPVFVRKLKDGDRVIVHRAAAALARMEDPSTTRPLIDALVTEHKVMTGGGGGVQPSFSNAGGGLSVGGGPKLEEKDFANEPVLQALLRLHPGVNFGFNQDHWRRWHAEQQTPRHVNLRRSD